MSAIHVKKNNFEEIVMNTDKPVLIDFWAAWCGPCRMQAPVIDELADELKGKAVVAKVDIDENPDLARKFSVMSIPTLIYVKDGKVAWRATGVRGKETLLDALNSVKSA